MADEEQLAILRRGVEAWSAWRKERLIRPNFTEPDLVGANLRGAELAGIDLTEVDLAGADLTGADLARADLARADLTGANLNGTTLTGANLTAVILTKANLAHANLLDADLFGASLVQAHLRRARLAGSDLTRADLSWAYLREANLHGANLHGANLYEANLYEADLTRADLTEARLVATIFANVDLCGCKGLESCVHGGPCAIDHRTLQRSGPLPLAFLRGVGLPDNLIDYLPSLLNQPIQFYSCFISYSSKDQTFAERLHADLQARGVRCWFAPHDLPIGAKILDTLDEAIRLRDKVLLILSEGALASDWVEGEVTRALDEERERKRPLLFPIRVDDAVLDTKEAWARLLRGQRHIGDFTRWKEHDAYQKALERLLRDLKVEASPSPDG